MYMEPFIVNDEGVLKAECEFCGKTIATKIDGKWVKHKTSND